MHSSDKKCVETIEMFLEQQISILEWFLKDHVTEDWSNDGENTASPSEE